VTSDSGNVTTDSGKAGKVVTIKRNQRSRSPGMGGHNQTEWVVTFRRNTHRLVHHSEIMVIEGGSYRMREAKERAANKKKTVKSRRKPAGQPAPKQPRTAP